jgi:hypothetical protein
MRSDICWCRHSLGECLGISRSSRLPVAVWIHHDLQQLTSEPDVCRGCCWRNPGTLISNSSCQISSRAVQNQSDTADHGHEPPKHPFTRHLRECHRPPRRRSKSGAEVGRHPLAGNDTCSPQGSGRRLTPGTYSGNTTRSPGLSPDGRTSHRLQCRSALIRFHDLRHSAVTLLLAQGVSAK